MSEISVFLRQVKFGMDKQHKRKGGIKHGKLNLLQRIALELLWAAAWIFAILPRWVKYYVVEEVIFFLLYCCFRYRIRVVRENLRNSFPEKSERERRVICRKFYHTLAEMIVDTFNMVHITPKKAMQILKLDDATGHRFMTYTRGRDWIALFAHFGCWEYGTCLGFYDKSHIIFSVYHPLHSRVADEFYKRLRNLNFAITVPMQETLRYYLRNRGKDGRNFSIGLIADQNPPLHPQSHWFRFLNQDTVFFDGGAKMALKFHLPVYFVQMQRLARGRYKMSFDLIYDGEEQTAPEEITERYVRKLETEIVRVPELWMWSHRRWKHKRTTTAPDLNP